MPDTGGFDVMLQFKQDIINDILVRVLNESLITNLHLKSPLSRLINEPVPPTQVKVWWDKPELEFDDADSMSLSVDVTGGARQLFTERNLSVDGSVSITRKALFTTDKMGAPYLYLEPPQPFDLHLSKLKVTYEGSKWPAPAFRNRSYPRDDRPAASARCGTDASTVATSSILQRGIIAITHPGPK